MIETYVTQDGHKIRMTWNDNVYVGCRRSLTKRFQTRWFSQLLL